MYPLLSNYETDEIYKDGLLHATFEPAVNGGLTTFRNIQVKYTTRQLDDAPLCIRFELRRYDNGDPSAFPNASSSYELLHWVKSGVVTVHSHTNQKKVIRKGNESASASASASSAAVSTPSPFPTSSPFPFFSLTRHTRPTLVEIIPSSSSYRGGERVAILGENFLDAEREMRVRFGDVVCIPEFFSSKTLICLTPRHDVGVVSVAVSNDQGKTWFEAVTKGSSLFTFIKEEDIWNEKRREKADDDDRRKRRKQERDENDLMNALSLQQIIEETLPI